MSYKGYRINTRVGEGDNYVSVNLKQGVKMLDILSLQINTEDLYQKHTSDYGVIVGRVLANNALGVPNVKVSVFVPLSQEDRDDYIMSNEYPFTTLQTRDLNGVRYNLLSDEERDYGTFPSKRMVLDNNGTVEVYEKYWKYTTRTNESGDYMIFGVPTGSCQTHYDCDLSDIGILSQKPYDLIEKGYDANLFKSKTKFEYTNLNSSVHVLSQDKTIEVYPFWGDSSENRIGITRNDINLDYEFNTSCVFMGSSITDSRGSYISADGLPSGANGRFGSLTTSVGDIEVIRKLDDGTVEELKDNVKGIIDGNGVWCYRIPMNLDRIGTDEYGNIVAVNDPKKGVATRARVRMRISLTNAMDEGASEYTAKILVPCNPKIKHSEDKNYVEEGRWEPQIDETGDDWENFYQFGSDTPDCCFRDLYWGKVYSVKQYYPRFQHTYADDDKRVDMAYGDRNIGYPGFQTTDMEATQYDYAGYPPQYANPFSCISSIDLINGRNPFPYTTMYSALEMHDDYDISLFFRYHLTEYAGNSSLTQKGLHFCFENDWINGCLYFPRISIQRLSKVTYEYFGRWNDDYEADPEHNNEYKDGYKNNFISGRHNIKFEMDKSRISCGSFVPVLSYTNFRHRGRNISPGKTFMHDNDASMETCNVSIFSRCNLFTGIVTRKETSIGQSVFYYRCGCVERSRMYFTRDKDTKKEFPETPYNCYKRLYSTDIILLGNLDDIYDTLPKLFEKLPSTTATFPPVVVPRALNESGMNRTSYSEQAEQMLKEDDSLIDIFGNKPSDLDYGSTYKGYDSEYGQYLFFDTRGTQLTEGAQVEDFAVMLQERYALFFGCNIWGCDDHLCYFTQTFINTSRICELDVHNDMAFKNPEGRIVPVNGMIDVYDIAEDENRSSFATMNMGINRNSIDSNTGHRKYVPTPTYISGFEGRLKPYIGNRFRYDGYINAYDEPDKSYIRFRYGFEPISYNSVPYIQRFCLAKTINRDYSGHIQLVQYLDDWSYLNGDLILPENSFYFYFGLSDGFSAIDKLRNMYYDDVKDISSPETCINVIVNRDAFECEGGVETSSCTVKLENLNYPVEYYIYYKNAIVKKGTTIGDFTLTGLHPGAYTIEVKDSSGVECSKSFSILKHGIQISANTYMDDNYRPIIEFLSVGSKEVTSVSGTSGTTNVVLETKTSGSTDVVVEKFNVEFSEVLAGVDESGNTVCFNDEVKTVNITITNSELQCISSNYTFYFGGTNALDATINGIFVDYIRPWSVPESGTTFDAKSTLCLDSKNYVFPSETISGETQIQRSIMSSMANSVFGGSAINLNTGTYDGKYVPVIIYPNSSGKPESLNPATNWEGGITGDNQVVSNITGYVNISKEIPDLVGSNYPNSYDTRTLLKGSVGGNSYVNNQSIITKTTIEDNHIYSINAKLLGIRHTSDINKQKPVKNLEPETPVNGTSTGNYEMSTSKGYLKLQTMDKRLDYQYVVKTPLLLPSGYENLTELKKYSLIDGAFNIDIYGGIRIDHDDFMRITCYENGHKGPTSGATLYSESVVEDGLPYNYSAETISVWEDDIDHEVWSGSTLSGRTSISFSAESCAPDVSSDYVLQGEVIESSVSYDSNITVVRDDGSDYDVEYTVEVTSGNTFNEYCASLSGTSMEFAVSGNTNDYTDVRYMSSPSANYPVWSKLYDSEPAYRDKTAALSVILCKPTGVQSYVVDSEYTVKDEIVPGEVELNPLVDDSVAICAYYINNNTTVYLNDSESGEYIHFQIDKEGNTFQNTLPWNGFIMIPSKRSVSSGPEGGSLKQGVVYNIGYAYYASSIWVKIDNNTKKGSIYLNTPLRKDSNGEDIDLSNPSADNYIGKVLSSGTIIDFSANTLSDAGLWHTIGEVDYGWTDDQNVASFKYVEENMRFDIELYDTTLDSYVYFGIKNGLKYKVKINGFHGTTE